jgi:predicted amidophosphoribosyltransferase
MDLINYKKHVVSCPQCNKDVLDHMDVCPHCGKQLRKQFDEEKLKRFRRIANIVGFAICAVLLVLILANRCSA